MSAKLKYDSIKVGDQIAAFVVEGVTRPDFVRYAGASGDFVPLHYDQTFVEAAGIPTVFAQGMFTAGLLSKALTDYVQARKFYDYNEHSRVGAKHGEFVTDEICDRFCVIGNVEQCTAKLRQLQEVGVDQFNIYLMTHGQEDTLQSYGDSIIPTFTGVPA